ncbi:acetate--CoA ligase family protein, partial [Cupriavidus sp. HPC(L)]|uniref:acetate--CoA ligase family protein n=1 Tax=Cupriavidus sp. HPC(L) TaxID=1217418 RepID=UPI0005BCE9C4
HKSEHGLVALGCNDAASIVAAFDRQMATLAGMGVEAEGVIVAKMVRGQRECMIGAHWDPVFGAVLVVGDGGKYVEVLRDTAVLLATCEEEDVARALQALRIAPLLAGVRGEAAVDMPALCRTAVAVGRMVHAAAGAIRSVDLNPVMASPDGVVVVDALMEVAS